MPVSTPSPTPSRATSPPAAHPSRKCSPRQAWQLLAPHYEAAVADPQNAADAMLLGAHLAGTAIENSMLGAAHATANPLTARYPLSHGRAVALMLPHVIRLNGQVVDDLYGELCADIQLNGSSLALAAHLEELCAMAGLPRRLADCQVAASDLPAMAQEAAGQWTGTFNPPSLTRSGFSGALWDGVLMGERDESRRLLELLSLLAGQERQVRRARIGWRLRSKGLKTSPNSSSVTTPSRGIVAHLAKNDRGCAPYPCGSSIKHSDMPRLTLVPSAKMKSISLVGCSPSDCHTC